MVQSSASERLPRKQATHIRFTREESNQIEEDAISTGKSIPTLLKESYFSTPRPLPLFARADLDKLSGDLGRIGNHLNQIARQLNSGIREGFVDELAVIQKSFVDLWVFLSSKYCRCNLKSERR